MSDILTQPKNISLLQSTKFQLAFNRMPNVKYFCQEVNLPGLDYPSVEQATPFQNRSVPGNKVHHRPLDIAFMLEETLESWLEIYRWIKGDSDQTSYDDYKNLNRQSKTLTQSHTPQFSDAVLTILTTQNNPSVRVTFRDCFPVSLSSIEFDTKLSAEEPLYGRATFEYFLYDIESIKVG